MPSHDLAERRKIITKATHLDHLELSMIAIVTLFAQVGKFDITSFETQFLLYQIVGAGFSIACQKCRPLLTSDEDSVAVAEARSKTVFNRVLIAGVSTVVYTLANSTEIIDQNASELFLLFAAVFAVNEAIVYTNPIGKVPSLFNMIISRPIQQLCGAALDAANKLGFSS